MTKNNKLSTKPNACLICGSKKIKRFPAKIFPFVLERIKKDDVGINLLKCNKCDFSFYDYRLNDEEMMLLYHNYRDEEYQKCREKYEERYTKELNDSLGKSEEEIIIRRRNLIVALTEGKVDMNKVETVLDFGGDKGQHISIDVFAKQKKYLYEVTDLELVAGIERVKSLENNKFDFVVSQHVLEHVSYPMEMMKQIVFVLKKGGYFYFELPFENIFPTKKPGFFRKISEKFWELPYLFDFNQERRRKKGKLFMMHEHINYFNKKSIEKMIKVAGLNLLYIDLSNPSLIFGIARNVN